jgi:uncharacterized protein YicC (UPF0701 family)
MQELKRDANTPSSNSQDDGTIRRDAVDMRVPIERMREQVRSVA